MVEEYGFNKKVYPDQNFLCRIRPTHSKELKSYDKPQGIWDIYSPTDVIHISPPFFFWQPCSRHLKKKFMKLNASMESPRLGHSLKAVFFVLLR